MSGRERDIHSASDKSFLPLGGLDIVSKTKIGLSLALEKVACQMLVIKKTKEKLTKGQTPYSIGNDSIFCVNLMLLIIFVFMYACMEFCFGFESLFIDINFQI